MTFAWSPTDPYLQRSRLRRFAEAHGHHDYASLQRWSIEDQEPFWRAVDRDIGLVWRTPYDRVLDSSRGIPWTTWWLGGRMNYVESALRHSPSRTAIIFEGEEGVTARITYGELATAVRRCAAGLRALGIRAGDRVGIFLPLTPECAIATLAVSAIGAIFTPIFSGYASDAIAGRLRDCDATVLITADGFRRRGQVVPMKETADAAVDRAPGVRTVIVVPRLGRDIRLRHREVSWDYIMSQGSDETIADTSPEDPYMLIYTSGTTGRPKGAVHVHGGFPVKAAQDQAHVFDLQAGDVLWWFTDIGWMMGPWLIAGGLINGATIVLYDGAPDYPDASRVWSIVERHHVTHLGISPTAIRGLMRAGEEPVRRHDRSSLFVLGSTGEPWNPEPWWWYFGVVGEKRAPLINYSGGTECSGGILGCTTWTPLKPTAFAGPVPGIAADVADSHGRSLRGAVGELVIRKPWPGMTRGFWRDPDKYLATYWNRYPNVWVHGDWARIDADGFWYIEGRSDDTLKVAGKRIGPAEVESAATAHVAVLEAAAIGVPHELKGEAIVVFAVLRTGYESSAAVAHEIGETIAERLGRPLRPDVVRFVSDLPKTRNAKILRRVIRAAYLGKDDLGDLSSLENPVAVEQIKELRVAT
ncbi:MAG: AMP-dependent synthetase [Gemmatimonadetes bacterium]|nr:MAG: AMP-dependent synthetase [Gemmatimonadetes bacterium 13_1_40CM_3_66_12]PYP96638.1 MAG: AMP-dependent synthetase [Gemmatimonadota bacterium]